MMSDSNRTPPWLDLLGMGEGKFGSLGAASGDMAQAWMKAWQAMLTERAVPAMSLFLKPPGVGADRVQEMLEALEAVLGTPRWSDFVSLDSDTLKSFAPAVELLTVAQAYTLETSRLCAEICGEFQKRIAANGLKLDGAGEALDLWNATVDETLIRFNRSERFADLQRRFLRAFMAYKLEQRWIVRRVSEQYDLPTRDEVDEITRRVHELERECRRLRRALAARSARPAQESQT